MGGAGATVAGSTGCDIGWAVACGMASFGENHVGLPVSPASGTRGAQAGTCSEGATGSRGRGVFGSAAGPGAQAGRPGGPDWGGATRSGSVSGPVSVGASGVGFTGALGWGKGGADAATSGCFLKASGTAVGAVAAIEVRSNVASSEGGSGSSSGGSGCGSALASGVSVGGTAPVPAGGIVGAAATGSNASGQLGIGWAGTSGSSSSEGG